MPSIRVLVVDDSALIRQMLTRALSMDPRVEIVGSAKNGVEAIEKSRELSPDVVTLDIEMPELTGLEALPHIQKHSDARIVMLSAVDDPETTYRALSLGAVDFIPKPHTGIASSMTELTEILLKKIKTAYRVTPQKAESIRREARPADSAPPSTRTCEATDAETPLLTCVGLAASTGGPPALERVIAGLAPEMPAAYLVTQHLPAGFTASLARRLDAVGDVCVIEADDGMAVRPGMVYLAPHGSHMRIRRQGDCVFVELSDAPAMHGVRPAADPMFESIAETFGDLAVGVVLTGMGSDGARGSAAIRAVGGEVIAQDEATSVVWGMPGAAVRNQAVNRIVSVGLVAAEVRRALRFKVGEGYAR